jgi:hypothetical protein
MPIGKRFKLEVATLAASEVHRNGKLVLVTIPAEDIVTVADVSGGKMVTVLWKDRRLFMFAADLEKRATEVSQETVGSRSGPAAACKVALGGSP